MENQTMEQELSAWAATAFLKAFPGTDAPEGVFAVARTTQESMGDYQCNAAMGLARVLRRAPRAIAEAAVAAAPAHPAIGSVTVAGPGFVNIRLDDAWVARRIEEATATPKLGVPPVGEGRTVVLDYSSPNVAKPMHVGHIRSTVIGNALDRLHRFLGYRVMADNHLGDWGTQFGLLILGFRRYADEARLKEAPVEELERVYVESYNRSRHDEAWADAARAELVKLQRGDAENRALWERLIDLSRSEFDRIYERLGVRFDLARGESYYNDALPGVVDRLQAMKLCRESEGAQVVDLEEEGLPVCIVRKRDGGYNYATTDLATVLDRERSFAPDAVIYVTDERQQLHFRQVFSVARRLGVSTRLVHVWFGLMRLPEGTFSTREGNVIRLERLLDEAEDRAYALVRGSRPDLAEEEARAIARAVGIGAVKYADLSQNPQSLVTFTWEKAMALDGNSAPYLQYAYARIARVKDKYIERFGTPPPDSAPLRLDEPLERRLGLALLRFPDAVLRAARTYRPSVVADYAYELAQAYSTYYQNLPFLRAPDGIRQSRVRLCGAVAETLRTALDLLGIETPDRI